MVAASNAHHTHQRQPPCTRAAARVAAGRRAARCLHEASQQRRPKVAARVQPYQQHAPPAAALRVAATPARTDPGPGLGLGLGPGFVWWRHRVSLR